MMILVLLTTNSPGQILPKTGELLITEFMANPGAVSDTKGEWVELLNATNETLLLTGLIVKDDGSNQFIIEGDEPILLLAGQYFLMARSADPEENGGITPNYTYSNFTLGNSEDEIILCLPDGTVMDQVVYNSEWQVNSGASLELNPDFMDPGFNDEPDNWNLASVPFGKGDLGSPGFANSSASGADPIGIIEYLEVFPNPCYGNLNIQLQLNKQVHLEISLINLLGQEIMIFESDPCQEVSLTIETEWLEKGVWLVRINYGTQTEISKVLIF